MWISYRVNHKGVLKNPIPCHCEPREAWCGNLNSLSNLEYEIAALPVVARNDANEDLPTIEGYSFVH